MMNNFTFFKRTAAVILATGVGMCGFLSEARTNKTPLSEKESRTFKNFQTRAEGDNSEPVLTEIITEVEGRAQNYLRYGSGFFSFGGTVWEYFEDTEPSPSTIVYGTDNATIYFQDLMDYGWETYTKGTINGNKVTVKLPQTLYEEVYTWAEEPYYHNLCVMTQTGEDSELSFEVDESITEVTYTIADDGTVSLDPLPEGKALGMMTYFIGKNYEDPDDPNSDYQLDWISYWDGAADFTQKFVPVGTELMEMPADVEPVTYYCAIEGYNYPVSVAIKDNYMYIQGLGDNPLFSNFVVRATIDGNVAYIPQNQYIGVLKYENEMMVTKCGRLKGNAITYENDDVNFEFSIDANKRFLETKDKNLYLCFAYMNQFDKNGENGLFTYMNNFYIIYQDSFPGTPSNPYGLFYHDDYYKEYGYHVFGFQMTAISNTSNMLLTGNLYYSIYVDGDIVEFEREEAEPYFHYSGLTEPTEELPYMFTNENDIDIWTPTERQIGLYFDGMTTVGVQAIYYYDDVRTVSDIVTLNLETGEIETTPAGVESIQIGKEVKSLEYYDLNGRKVSNPGKGLYIKKAIMEDGTMRTTKVMNR